MTGPEWCPGVGVDRVTFGSLTVNLVPTFRPEPFRIQPVLWIQMESLGEGNEGRDRII